MLTSSACPTKTHRPWSDSLIAPRAAGPLDEKGRQAVLLGGGVAAWTERALQ